MLVVAPEGGVVVVVGGTNVTVAVADLLASAVLVAVIVTVWADAMEDGATYVPPDSDPTEGFIDQVTPVAVVPVTVAVKLAVCPADRDAVAGLILMPTLTGVVTVSDPAVLVMDPVVPSSSASRRFVTCIAEEPLALLAMVAVIVATTPLPSLFEFRPARMHVPALQDTVFPADEAAEPG